VTTVVLVDDQQLVRDGLRLILELAGIDVVGEAGDGEEGARLVLDLHPDVVLMDLRMPRVDGIEATRRIVAAGSGTRVLVLTTFEGEELTFRALQAGAAGYLLKDAGGARLVSAVESAAELYISLPTVKSHVRHILAKLDLRDRPQAIVLAHECGLVGEGATR